MNGNIDKTILIINLSSANMEFFTSQILFSEFYKQGKSFVLTDVLLLIVLF